MQHKVKMNLLRSATQRRIATCKALKIELGNDLKKWTNRSRIKRHVIASMASYVEKEVSYFLKLKLLWADSKKRIRWTKIGRRISNQILRLIGLFWCGGIYFFNLILRPKIDAGG